MALNYHETPAARHSIVVPITTATAPGTGRDGDGALGLVQAYRMPDDWWMPCPPGRSRATLLALLVALPPLGLSSASFSQTIPPSWRNTWDFLVQAVCTDGNDRPLPGTSPLDGPAACPRQRKLGFGEPLPYYKRDWPGVDDREQNPGGYQQSDSVPVQTSLGPAVVQTYDFGDASRSFGQFDNGDGGQVAFFSTTTASFGITEDGGAGLQLFLGPGCGPEDGWVIVDRSFATRQDGATLARITRNPGRCPGRLGYAYTRWHVQPVTYRDSTRGRAGRATLSTLVSEHFGGKDVGNADHLERMYFTHELGYTRWERWQNLGVHDRPRDRAQAAEIAGTGRCEPGLGAPDATSRWVMIDCREWTQIIPATAPRR